MTALLTVAVGVATGVLSALCGVGGGIIMVSFMVLALDRGQHLAEGTSLLVIVPTAIVGVAAHMRNGYVALREAAWVGAGGVAGALVGAQIALGVPGPTLRRGFAVFLVLIAIRLVIQALRQPEREPAA